MNVVTLRTRLLRAMTEAGADGLSLSGVSRLFSGHVRSHEIRAALDELEERGMVTCEKRLTAGGPLTIYRSVPEWRERSGVALRSGVGGQSTVPLLRQAAEYATGDLACCVAYYAAMLASAEDAPELQGARRDLADVLDVIERTMRLLSLIPDGV